MTPSMQTLLFCTHRHCKPLHRQADGLASERTIASCAGVYTRGWRCIFSSAVRVVAETFVSDLSCRRRFRFQVLLHGEHMSAYDTHGDAHTGSRRMAQRIPIRCKSEDSVHQDVGAYPVCCRGSSCKVRCTSHLSRLACSVCRRGRVLRSPSAWARSILPSKRRYHGVPTVIAMRSVSCFSFVSNLLVFLCWLCFVFCIFMVSCAWPSRR